jgi:aminoglycoside phosphotransferase family enzyme
MNSELISALLKPEIYPHACSELSLIETHISWVILTGDFAYKIKKPVNFGFLDFTSLPARKQYCDAELNLNSRSAPELYLGVLNIYGSAAYPSFEEIAGDVIEYAVKMHQFKNGHLLSELHDSGELSFLHIDELAERVARFHEEAKRAESETRFGHPEQLIIPAIQNFEQIRERLQNSQQIQQLAYLEKWTISSFKILGDTMISRKKNGLVRECHGDLHLKNITLFRDRVTLFDCIEFNEGFRWIDVISDMAFLVMDLEERGLQSFANRFLNHYLEVTGDYEGLRLLPFYKAYRAIIRAKISLFEMADYTDDQDEVDALWSKYQSYIDLAESYTALPNRFVLTMHGFSGTGKSTVALRLVDQLGAIRIRSDVERKRLFGIDPRQHPGDSHAREMYASAGTDKTYHRLADLTGVVLDSGVSVVVDATSLMEWQRAIIEQQAANRGVPLGIADCQAAMSVIEEWIHRRESSGDDTSDADFSVVDRQVAHHDPLSPAEKEKTFVIHSNVVAETNELVSEIRKQFL